MNDECCLVPSGLPASFEAAGQRLHRGSSAGGRDVLPDPGDPGAPRALPGASRRLRRPVARQADRRTPPHPISE